MPLAATLLALSTVTLWSFLAFFGARLSHLPPLLVVGIALCVAGVLGAIRLKDWKVPRLTFLVGIGGLFGYHFLYFTAYQYAPPVEASLINYLWPLLIVLLSPLILPGYRLQAHHLVGALAGLAGAALIASGGRLNPDPTYLAGYVIMACAALTWAVYSLLTKRLPPFPTGAVGGFCLASGVLSLAVFLLTSQPGAQGAISLTAQDWLLLILLGAGPMGLAFFTWDAALKRGDPRVIGSLAYLTPLTSTLILVLLDGRSLTWVTALAMVLIVGGALIGSLDLLRSARLNKTPGNMNVIRRYAKSRRRKSRNG
jgi:drug/metabolite transporter (DMT)-like permease